MYLFSFSDANSSSYSLPVLQLYLTLYRTFQFVSKYICCKYPVFFQSAYSMPNHNPLFRMIFVVFFSSADSSQFLFLSRIIFLLSLFIYGPWNMLFCRINKRQKAWKIFLYFLGCFQSFGYVVYLLWNR